VEIEKESALAAQAHFGLAGLYRKQGKAAEAQHEMREFQRLRTGTKPGKGTSTLGREFAANTGIATCPRLRPPDHCAY
jgi:hypothetical protein